MSDEMLDPPDSAGGSPGLPSGLTASAMATSPTLAALAPSRLPKPLPVCATGPSGEGRCEAALWHATAEDVRCYCQVLRLMVWTRKEPECLTHCDGYIPPQEQEDGESTTSPPVLPAL